MKYIVNIIVFEIFYMIMYVLPAGILLMIYEEKIKKIFPPNIGQSLTLILGIIAMAAFIFSGYRARIAAKCKVDNNMKFLQAHRTSWAMIKTNLSFLPIIGNLFKNKDEE